MRLFLCILTIVSLSGCDATDQAPKPELLIYCGITMTHPIKELAAAFEKKNNVTITVSQGGSEDLYTSLKTSRKGDLYLPGSASYRERHLEEGLLGDAIHLGYNQIAMLVKQGNPKTISSDLNQLIRADLAVVIGNADTSSIGRETQRVLEQQGLYQAVLDHSVFITTDSRNLNKALRDGDADIIMNWRATAFFPRNKDLMQIVNLPQELATPKKLVLNLLSFSDHPKIAREFMQYAASAEGQAVFRSYGFLDNQMKY